MNSVSRRSSRLLALLTLSTLAGAARAATYLPLSDEELARRSPVIVRARVIAQETRLETVDGSDTAVTVTRFQPLEVIKGRDRIRDVSDRAAGRRRRGRRDLGAGNASFALAEDVLFLLARPRAAKTYTA